MKKNEKLQERTINMKLYFVTIEYRGRDRDKERQFVKAAGFPENSGGFYFGDGGISDLSWSRYQKPAAMRIFKRLKAFKAKAHMRFKLTFDAEMVSVARKYPVSKLPVMTA